jgi:signal transduction histidine kinase
VLRSRAAKDEAHRIRRIVQTMLSFTQEYGGDGFTDVDLNGIVDGVLRAVPVGTIEVARELDPSLPTVLGSSAQLEEAITQLVRNALTAMVGGGRLTVRTSLSDGLVRIEISDTGKGIAPEHLDKIFDPFFTTKDQWSGAGLGLTITHRIVEQHHGRIRVSSQVGEGSTFAIVLPPGSRRSHLL